MAKDTFRIDSTKYRKNFFFGETKLIGTVSAFRALKIEKSLLTIKLEGFIKNGIGLQSSTVARKCQKNWVCYRCNIFLLTILSTPSSNLHHKACSVPPTNSYKE